MAVIAISDKGYTTSSYSSEVGESFRLEFIFRFIYEFRSHPKGQREGEERTVSAYNLNDNLHQRLSLNRGKPALHHVKGPEEKRENVMFPRPGSARVPWWQPLHLRQV